MTTKKAIIIGAVPVGLTAAFELASRTDITPLVPEISECVGGISRTVDYKGNLLDIGSHRFFSKSDCVMQCWLQRTSLQEFPSNAATAYAYPHARADGIR
jgi:protoporphyrinogen oxidase